MRLLFLLLSMFLSLLLFAQATTENRWTVSAGLGFNLGHSQYRFTRLNRLDSQYEKIMIGTNYRLNRWFELTGRLAGIRHHNYTVMYIERFSQSNERTSIPFSIYTNTNLLALTLGGRLILRINQGDLFIGGSYGLNLQWQSVDGSDLYGTEFQYSYKSQSYTMSKLEIGYTYWLTKNFGFDLGLEATLYTADKILPRDSLKKNTLILSSLTISEQHKLRGDLIEFLTFLNIGLTYRF